MQMDERILKLVDELDAYRKTRDDAWQVPRIEAELLHQIALSSNAKIILEVGTSYGFSGLFWGAAAQRNGGVLHTIDINQKKFDSSRKTFELAGLGKVITNHLGDAAKVLPTIQGPVDIAFLDGSDKHANRTYFDLIWPAIRPGGSVLIDNVTTHKNDLADYVAYVRSRRDAVSAEVAVGNGVEWTIKSR